MGPVGFFRGIGDGLRSRGRHALIRILQYDGGISRKAKVMAGGDEIKIAGYGRYRRNEYEQGMCILVLTPWRLVYCSEFDSRGNPLEEYVRSIRIDEIEEISYKGTTLVDLFTWCRLAWAFVIRGQDTDTVQFNVEDARDWCKRLRELAGMHEPV